MLATFSLPLLFERCSDNELLGYCLPKDWLVDVRQATEETLLDLAGHLPSEAGEALLALAVGNSPNALPCRRKSPQARSSTQSRCAASAFLRTSKNSSAPSTTRGTNGLFSCIPRSNRSCSNVFRGQPETSGSAGTGKTVVAIHRAANLLKREPQAKLLLTTFSLPLANALEGKLRILVGYERASYHV